MHIFKVLHFTISGMPKLTSVGSPPPLRVRSPCHVLSSIPPSLFRISPLVSFMKDLLNENLTEMIKRGKEKDNMKYEG